MTLKSHPDKLLSTHVSEVREAAKRIWNQHSPTLRASTDLLDWIEWAVTLHDVGKGCSAFQKYINDVGKFPGDRRLKAHTPLSFVTALAIGKGQDWNWRKTLAASVCALGHHSEFKTHEELQTYLRNADWQDILVGQLDGIDWNTVSISVLPVQVLQPFTQPFSDDSDLDLLAGWLEDAIIKESLHKLILADAFNYRLRCQFVHSVLLEADKAYLIISEEERDRFRRNDCHSISTTIVEDAISKSNKGSALDELRNTVRWALKNSLENGDLTAVQTMTLPTGSGKTLLATTWALHYRETLRTEEHTPPIVIVLPFLSIIEQTQKIYSDLLSAEDVLLSYHSLSVRDHQDSEDPNTAEFFLDTWHGDVIITTFDQFLFALLDPHARYQMRFHQLCDALIVMDEVQALPCQLWDIVSQSLTQLTKIGNCRMLAMSATQTGFLPMAAEIIENPRSIFESLDRYEILLRHRDVVAMEDFIDEVLMRARDWQNERVLVVLNTRNSARTLRDELEAKGHHVYFISADVTPRDRLAVIDEVKVVGPCIVVATQCIEAGVDLDMSLVIRDFAPLDSLIQVAGRCNRNADRSREVVEFVRLKTTAGKQFCTMIYDKVLLQETSAILDACTDNTGINRVPEKDIFSLSQRYFESLRARKDLGARHASNFARWEQMPPIRELLRGVQSNQVSFVVVQGDPTLYDALKQVSEISDRWDRRRELRKLSARISAISVSVYCMDGFEAGNYADRDATDSFWLLRSGYYHPKRGLDLTERDSDQINGSWGITI